MIGVVGYLVSYFGYGFLIVFGVLLKGEWKIFVFVESFL